MTPKKLFDADAETQLASPAADLQEDMEEEDEEDENQVSEEGSPDQGREHDDDIEESEHVSAGSPSEDKDLFGQRFAFQTPNASGTRRTESSCSKGSVVGKTSKPAGVVQDETPPSAVPILNEASQLLHKLDKKMRDVLPPKMHACLVTSLLHVSVCF